MGIRIFAGVLAGVLTLAGCSSQQMYDSAQGARRQQCDRIVDQAEHARCMAAADADRDSYQRERLKVAPLR